MAFTSSSESETLRNYALNPTLPRRSYAGQGAKDTYVTTTECGLERGRWGSLRQQQQAQEHLIVPENDFNGVVENGRRKSQMHPHQQELQQQTSNFLGMSKEKFPMHHPHLKVRF